METSPSQLPHQDLLSHLVQQYLQQMTTIVTIQSLSTPKNNTTSHRQLTEMTIHQQKQEQFDSERSIRHSKGSLIEPCYDDHNIQPTTIPQGSKIPADKTSIINLTYENQAEKISPWLKSKFQESKAKPLPIQFKKHQKMYTQRTKENQHQYFKTSSDLRKSTESKNHKHHGYNPMNDQSLVQYFYTKQNTLPHQARSPQSNNKKEQSSPKKVLRQCLSEKNNQFSNIFKINKNRPYEVSNEIGRNASFNSYDLLSCQLSLSPSSKITKKVNPVTSDRKKGKKQAVSLKKRMVDLQTKVMDKLPYLVKMGISFKKNKK